MGKLLNIITPLHKKTKRDYLARMQDDKVHCMTVAKKYGFDYWDGNRRYGYGGYRYDGRWKGVAQKLIKQYKLSNKSLPAYPESSDIRESTFMIRPDIRPVNMETKMEKAKYFH